MIESFKKSFLVLLKNPFVLIPALFSAIVMLFLSDLVSWPMLETLYEFIVEYKGIQLGFFKMIIAFYQLYASNLFFFSIVFFIAMFLITALLFFYSKYAMHYSEKDAFFSSIKYAMQRIPRAIGFVVFTVLSVFCALLALLAIILFFPMDFMFNTILFFLFAIIFAIAFLKLYLFAVPAMVLDDLSVRGGITKSWNFTEKKTLETILGLIIVFFTAMIIIQVGVILLESFQQGIITLIIAAIFNSFAFAFGSLFFAFYYFNNYSEVEKPKRKGKKRK